MPEAAVSSLTSIYAYIYQTVQNHTPDDIFLVIALRISNITVLQHVRDFPRHTVFNILFLAEVTKLAQSFLHQTVQGSLYLFRYTHSDIHVRCLNIEITHYEVG